MGVDNRLTAEQLAALEPGDTVTIESAQDFRRPSLPPGASSASPARTSS
jgi:hypothetical protein